MTLILKNVSKAFKTKQGSVLALKEITMQIEAGEFVCVVGASGSGKSTLLRLVAGLEKPTSGSILVDNRPVSGPGSDRGMVFQHYTLYPWLTVEKNVEFGLKLQGLAKDLRRTRVETYLQVVGLAEFAQAYPKQLSGGMKQRVAIARALVCSPRILLLDEPFGALDVQTKESMQQFLREVWAQTKTSVLMITHDVSEAVFLSQRVYVLSRHPGTVREEFQLELPPQRDYTLKRDPTFQAYEDQIAALIRE